MVFDKTHTNENELVRDVKSTCAHRVSTAPTMGIDSTAVSLLAPTRLSRRSNRKWPLARPCKKARTLVSCSRPGGQRRRYARYPKHEKYAARQFKVTYAAAESRGLQAEVNAGVAHDTPKMEVHHETHPRYVHRGKSLRYRSPSFTRLCLRNTNSDHQDRYKVKA